MLVVADVKVNLFIKHMVSLRCKLKVKDELQLLHIKYVTIDLGVVEILEEISPEQRKQLKINLLKSGLELLDDKNNMLIEKIQNVVVEMIYYSNELLRVDYLSYISEKLNYNCAYLSTIFAEVKGITLQNYIIVHKIEKAKELLLCEDLNLTEISCRLQYSSVAHLSSQFKKITGLTPSFYKQIKDKQNASIENL